MKTGSHEPKSLVQILLVVVAAVSSTKLDALSKEAANVNSTGHDIEVLVCNVVLHASLLVDGQLDALVDGSSQTLVIVTGIDIVSVVLGVVNVVWDRC